MPSPPAQQRSFWKRARQNRKELGRKWDGWDPLIHKQVIRVVAKVIVPHVVNHIPAQHDPIRYPLHCKLPREFEELQKGANQVELERHVHAVWGAFHVGVVARDGIPPVCC